MQRIILTFIILLFGTLFGCDQKKRTNWTEHYYRNSKDPYGCYIAYNHLKSIFPSTTVKSGQRMMAQIEKSNKENTYSAVGGHVIVVVAKGFFLDSNELEAVKKFINRGNGLLVFAKEYSQNIYDFLGLINKDTLGSNFIMQDTLSNQKLSLYFNSNEYVYSFNGVPMKDSFVYNPDSIGKLYIYGTNTNENTTNYINYYDSSGVWGLHKNPAVLSNYFLLQGNNRDYYEKLFSSLNQYLSSITWYTYTYKSEGEESSESSWTNLLKSEPLRYAFWILLLLMVLYALLAGRRRQRIIPYQEPNKNTSLEFVETVGMVYFNQKNNEKLAQKIVGFYLEQVRFKYGFSTSTLDDALGQKLAAKLAMPYEEIISFIKYLDYIRHTDQVNDNDIKHLHTQCKKYI